MGPQVIRAVGLGKQVDERALLRGIDLEIPRGCLVALWGPTGRARARCSAAGDALDAHSRKAGALWTRSFGGQARGQGPHRAHRPPAHALSRSVRAENLEFFAAPVPGRWPRERAKSCWMVPGLSDRANEPVGSLSRGMAQRVAICRALVHDRNCSWRMSRSRGWMRRPASDLGTLLTGLRDRGARRFWSPITTLSRPGPWPTRFGAARR